MLIFKDSEYQGDAGETIATLLYQLKGYNVRLWQTDGFDAIAYSKKNSEFLKLQSKTTNFNNKLGYPIATLNKPVKDFDCDRFIISCGNGIVYDIPKKEIEHKKATSLKLTPKYDKYKTTLKIIY